MRQHRRIEQGLIARIARDGGGEAVRQRETRVSCQMRKEIATRETLTGSSTCRAICHFGSSLAVTLAACLPRSLCHFQR